MSVRRFKAVLHEDEILAHPSPEAYKWSGEVVLASAYDAERQRRVEAELALRWLVNLYCGMSKGGPETSPPSDAEFEDAIEAGKAHLARYKEAADGPA